MENNQNKFYNNNSKYFEQLSSHDEEYFNEYLLLIKHFVPVGSTILDFGCGTGQSTELISCEGYHATGVDGSEKYITRAKIKFPDKNFIVANANNLPFPDSSFDAVASLNTLEHLDNLEAGLKELARITKPKGLIIIEAPNLLSFRHITNAFSVFKGMTFEGKKNTFQLLRMLFRNIYWLTKKRISKKIKIIYRQPDFDYTFPDNDATCFLNPIDIQNYLISLNCKIISYQDIGAITKISFKKKIGSLLFPDHMGIIRIVAQKYE